MSLTDSFEGVTEEVTTNIRTCRACQRPIDKKQKCVGIGWRSGKFIKCNIHLECIRLMALTYYGADVLTGKVDD